ncbi:hypothetical protein NECAME_06508 [Necator americanus]|uniref:Uncharacterized protein n=1 Tax=Necator americanus TaxID=51031 RepID=W2TTU8_NECAM|nr:hypothetical protein NECAME_06508 [Necator americanus]ETN85213.1 hypothetical protein NECAME_06508 [Necator americanus]
MQNPESAENGQFDPFNTLSNDLITRINKKPMNEIKSRDKTLWSETFSCRRARFTDKRRCGFGILIFALVEHHGFVGPQLKN